jgi:hypothetical protein
MQPGQNANFPQSQTDRFDPTVEADTSLPASESSAPGSGTITWQASEFVHYEKSGIWFLVLLIIATALALVGVFVFKNWTFAVLIVVMAVAIVVIGRRPPRMVEYMLSPGGITIDQKHFNLHDFKYFGVVQEGAFYSVRLVPHKRFMPMVSVFLPSDQAEQIVDIFGTALPMERVELDIIDRFVERIRF